MKKEKTYLNKLILSAIFLALGMVLPLLSAQVKEIGDSLLPMHIPVMLCGFICGARYGFLVGFSLPFLRSAIFSMPPMYPNAVWMAAELAIYGCVTGFLYAKSSNKSIKRVYFCLVSAMISGRFVWGAAKTILLGLSGKTFTLSAFIVGGIVDAIPGIILQLILIPIILSVVLQNKNDNKKRKTGGFVNESNNSDRFI